MSDESDSEDSPSESPGSWREYERVDEQYREPEEVDPFDVEPEIPSPPDPSGAGADVDTGLVYRFWVLVFVFNLALLATSVGAMFVVFEEKVSLGGRLLVAGFVVFGFGLYRYRTARATIRDQSDGSRPDRDDERNR